MYGKIEFNENEESAVMELLLLAETLLDVKSKLKLKDSESGKSHLYMETADHRKRTNNRK